MKHDEIKQLQQQCLEWALQLEHTESLAAAEQVLRARVHPQLFDSLQRIQRMIEVEDAGWKRHVAETLGYDALASVFPDSQPFVDQYKHSGVYGHRFADEYMNFLVLASFFDEHLLHKFIASVMAEEARKKLSERLDAAPFTEERFQREIDEIQRIAEHTTATGTAQSSAQYSVPLRPLVFQVRDGEDVTSYHLRGDLHLYNPYTHEHGMVVHEPVPATSYQVDKQLTIPWERAQHGLTLQVSLQEVSSIRRHPTEVFLSPAQLKRISTKGSAVRTRIGMGAGTQEKVRMHPEHFGPVAMDRLHALPKEDVATVRVRNGSVDIRRLDANALLTVVV